MYNMSAEATVWVMYRVGYAKVPTDHDDMKFRTGYVDKTIRIMHACHHR